jgi:hypothetical protein
MKTETAELAEAFRRGRGAPHCFQEEILEKSGCRFCENVGLPGRYNSRLWHRRFSR